MQNNWQIKKPYVFRMDEFGTYVHYYRFVQFRREQEVRGKRTRRVGWLMSLSILSFGWCWRGRCHLAVSQRRCWRRLEKDPCVFGSSIPPSAGGDLSLWLNVVGQLRLCIFNKIINQNGPGACGEREEKLGETEAKDAKWKSPWFLEPFSG